MKINGIIQRKLALLETQLVELEIHLRDVSEERFRENWALRSMTERALQVAIEIVIDICARLLALSGRGPVATSADAIRHCVKAGFLARETPYLQMIGYRNLLVHQYESLDPAITFEIATRRLADFRAFRDEIDRLSGQP